MPWVPQTKTSVAAPEHTSSLLLRISAAADYFTTNATLMAQPQTVHVDLILDPFLANVLPRSLVSTVCYILAVALASWVLAWRLVVPTLKVLLSSNGEKKKQY